MKGASSSAWLRARNDEWSADAQPLANGAFGAGGVEAVLFAVIDNAAGLVEHHDGGMHFDLQLLVDRTRCAVATEEDGVVESPNTGIAANRVHALGLFNNGTIFVADTDDFQPVTAVAGLPAFQLRDGLQTGPAGGVPEMQKH